MTERPILMTPENAQKCFDGTKLQTRRLNGLNHVNESPDDWLVMAHDPTGLYWSFVHRTKTVKRGGGIVELKCPYGVPGDRLWVRETTALWREGWDRTGHVVFRGGMVDQEGNDFSDQDLMGLSKWTPSIHMKRVYCRSVLDLTEIRVQRLQEITVDDIRAEGVKAVWPELDEHESAGGKYVTEAELLRDGFLQLWSFINGPGSWAVNPWVWCVSFKRVHP